MQMAGKLISIFLIFTYNQGKVFLIFPIFTCNQGKVSLILPITRGSTCIPGLHWKSPPPRNLHIAGIVQYSINLLPTNANLGRIMRIMETNISLLELLFVLNNQIIDINI